MSSSRREYQQAIDEYGEVSFTAGIGAEAIRDMLAAIDLEEDRLKILAIDLKETNSEAKRKKLVKRLKLIEAFIASGARPEWMIPHTHSGHSAGTASAGAIGWRPFRNVRS